jgi:hypothetical protein
MAVARSSRFAQALTLAKLPSLLNNLGVEYLPGREAA